MTEVRIEIREKKTCKQFECRKRVKIVSRGSLKNKWQHAVLIGRGMGRRQKRGKSGQSRLKIVKY